VMTLDPTFTVMVDFFAMAMIERNVFQMEFNINISQRQFISFERPILKKL
jgi:hypothetical protein